MLIVLTTMIVLRLEYLISSFATVPLPYIRRLFEANSRFFAPTLFALNDQQSKSIEARAYKTLSGSRHSKGKGKEIASVEFEREKLWAFNKIAKDEQDRKKLVRAAAKEKADSAAGLLIECECCGGDSRLEVMGRSSFASLSSSSLCC
jgi:hypothetical protein